MGWGGYLIVGLIILALLSALIKGVTVLMLEKNPGDGLAIVLIWAIVCLIGGFFFHRAFIKQEYRFSKSDRTVSVHDLYAGEKFSDPEIFNDIVAVVPLRVGKDRMTVALLYETAEGIRHCKLFRKPDIPKPKVIKPQFKVHPGVNPGDDAYRRHQMEQEYLRESQMEALRMQQQRQQQIWRETEARRIQQQQQQEIQRRQLYDHQFRNRY